jgi:peptide/nickel transport system substrate-binding protein
MRRALAPAAALVASLMCVSGAAAAGGDLRIGSPQAFETPNPFKAIEAISVESQASQYYDQLLGLRQSDQAAVFNGSALAKSAVVSRDGKTITFHLKSGIHWSDGKPFTSADPLWTFNALLKNKTNQLVGGVPALKSVSAPDKQTFVMHLPCGLRALPDRRSEAPAGRARRGLLAGARQLKDWFSRVAWDS